MDLKRLSMGRIGSEMAATDACTADWITVSSNVPSMCVTMVGVSVITAVDKAAASCVVVVAPSVEKRVADNRLIRSGLEKGRQGDIALGASKLHGNFFWRLRKRERRCSSG